MTLDVQDALAIVPALEKVGKLTEALGAIGALVPVAVEQPMTATAIVDLIKAQKLSPLATDIVMLAHDLEVAVAADPSLEAHIHGELVALGLKP